MTTWTKQAIIDLLDKSDVAVVHGLLAIHARQTATEQATQCTKDKNGVGFNGADAEILSSFAEQFQAKKFLTRKQVALARKKIRKYSGQLLAISEVSTVRAKDYIIATRNGVAWMNRSELQATLYPYGEEAE